MHYIKYYISLRRSYISQFILSGIRDCLTFKAEW
jgi:hypothetical protein